LQWLHDEFTVVTKYLEDIEAEQFARAYIMHMFGTCLFSDTTTNKVHLRWLLNLDDLDVCGAMSWGNAVLAYLYMVLYKTSTMGTTQLHSCLTLL